ncbi:MAG: PepSY domain-containing protein [Gemmatimonadota bacterium]|nr:PepSY domain-containing protein [Gemmatimonadota bacterium]
MKYNMKLLAFASAIALAAPLHAQAPKVTEAKPGLLKQATITADAATASALAKVPNGKIKAAEIEEEKGKLIYSFDITVAGKKGIEEVAVDAKTGVVLSVEHESPAAEAKEAKKDKADSLKALKKAGMMKKKG